MSARVLVVDDVDVNVRLLEAKLSSEYFTVITASSGAAALRLAHSEHPDIILLDSSDSIWSALRVRSKNSKSKKLGGGNERNTYLRTIRSIFSVLIDATAR